MGYARPMLEDGSFCLAVHVKALLKDTAPVPRHDPFPRLMVGSAS